MFFKIQRGTRLKLATKFLLKFCCLDPTSHFTCTIAAIMKKEKTNGISLSNTYTTKYIEVKTPRSCCVEDCSNNVKSQPDLNFYILPSDKQRCRRWLQEIGRDETYENGKVLDKTWSAKTRYHYVCSEHFVTD